LIGGIAIFPFSGNDLFLKRERIGKIDATEPTGSKIACHAGGPSRTGLWRRRVHI
jgi:hypothetical protein